MICINKIDLGLPAELAADLAPYEALGYPVHWTSAVTGTRRRPPAAASAASGEVLVHGRS